MGSLIDSITDKLRSVFGQHTAKSDTAGEGLQRPVTPELELYDKLAISNARKEVITKCNLMRRTDPRIHRMIEKLAADAVLNGMTITVDSGVNEKTIKDSQDIIDYTTLKTEIGSKLKGWVVNMLNSGDTFLEVIADEKTKSIVRLKKLATSITMSNMNSEGNFPESEDPYYQVNPATNVKILGFKQWQIVQMSWDREDGEPYGRPLFSSYRTKWDMLIKSEENVVVRRLLRATKRLLHVVGTSDRTSTWQVVDEYKKQNREALKNPMSCYHDYFSNGASDIKEIVGDTTIGDIEDLKYLEGLGPIASGVPKALLGREESINRDVLKDQVQDYMRVLASINESIEGGLRNVFDFALLLNGINPDSIKYSFKWGNKDRSELTERLKDSVIMKNIGYDFQTIHTYLNIPDTVYEETIKRIEEQKSLGLVPYGPMKADSNVGNNDPESNVNTNANQTGIKETLERLLSIVEEEQKPGSRIIAIQNK